MAEAADSHIMARAFPHTLGQPLAHFLRETAKVSDAHIITELPSIRCASVFDLSLFLFLRIGIMFDSPFGGSSIQLKLSVFYSRVGIVFSGRQAPGGHNVIWGLYEALKVHNAKSTLLGFLGMFLLSLILYHFSVRDFFFCFTIHQTLYYVMST